MKINRLQSSSEYRVAIIQSSVAKETIRKSVSNLY